MDESTTNYFTAGKASPTYTYRMERHDLRDSRSVHRDLVTLFKSAFMRDQDRIDFKKWQALDAHGYCFAPKAAAPDDRALAMDIRTKNGFVTEVVIGPLPSCRDARIDTDFDKKYPLPKPGAKIPGGC